MFIKYYISKFVTREKYKRAAALSAMMAESVGYIFENLDDMKRYIDIMNLRIAEDKALSSDGAHFGFGMEDNDGVWTIEFFMEKCPVKGSFAALVIGEIKGSMYVSHLNNTVLCHPFLTQITINKKGGGNGK